MVGAENRVCRDASSMAPYSIIVVHFGERSCSYQLLNGLNEAHGLSINVAIAGI
jgi:hypothetical protein